MLSQHNHCKFCYFRLGFRALEMKKVIATLRALVEVLEALSKDADPDGVGRLIKEEVFVCCLPLNAKLMNIAHIILNPFIYLMILAFFISHI